MKRVLLFSAIFIYNTCLFAQRKGADTLSGYIVKLNNDTVMGKVIFPFTSFKSKGEIQKEYKREDWYEAVSFMDNSGKVSDYSPGDINAYSVGDSGVYKYKFRAFDITIANKGLLLTKGKGRQFLLLSIEGDISMYFYYHREDALGVTAYLNDCYLLNEKGEIRALKLKKSNSKYRVTEVEDLFTGFPDISKYDLKAMYSFELADLVRKYNAWKKKVRS